MSFLEIFQPSLRHLREEREQRRHAVQHPKAGGGAPFGIDLDAGTAVIRIPAPPQDDDPATVDGTGEGTGVVEVHEPDSGSGSNSDSDSDSR